MITNATRLEEACSVFDRWLHLPDKSALHVVLGTVAANLLPGDPVWLLVVGPPGGGKSEILQSLCRLPNTHPTATLTEAALLSGSSAKDKAKDARGGLLREIGAYGAVICKDFGSVLSMHSDARAQLLAALREVYDGSWTRHVGTDGGRTLAWEGKVALIGGCTQSVDRFHGFISTMGERFVYLRLPKLDEREHAARALVHAGREKQMRDELAAAVAELFADGLPTNPRPLDDDDRERLISLATFTVRARSAVERDGRTREIELIPDSEAPSRLVLVLARLLAGLDALGLERDQAWPLITKVSLDSIPSTRMRLLQAMPADDAISTSDIAAIVDYPRMTAVRALEDLAAHGVVKRYPQGQGKADLWALTNWTTQRLAEIGGCPEMPEGAYKAREPLSQKLNGKSGQVQSTIDGIPA